MRLDEIVELRPQMAEIESGAEPSLRMLIEKYYQPHFPELYKQMTEEYLDKLQGLLEGDNSSELIIGDLVKVVFDSQEGTPESFSHDGVIIGAIGMITSIDTSDFPVDVRFNTGEVVGFKREELRKV